MSISYLETARNLSEELCQIRRTIHACPEMGNSEIRTCELVERNLRNLGIETYRPLPTAVVGVLRFSEPGRCCAFRADMDALPIKEETGCSFSSRNEGIMHACGHDVHVAALLGAARLLSQKKDALRGEARFIFQPDEEGDGGANRLIQAGVLKGADAIFGAHVSPDLPAGTFGIRFGKFYAASNPFDVTFYGKSAHGAEPEKGIDALYAAAIAAASLKELMPRLRKEYGECVVTVGSFHSGTARNIIADKAQLQGILRTLGPEARAAGIRAVKEAVQKASEKVGCTFEITVTDGYPGVVNHSSCSLHAQKSLCDEFDASSVIMIENPTMTTEDFGYYLQEIPGAYFHIGVGGNFPLHSPHFLPPEEVIAPASAAEARILSDYLLEE